MTHERKDFVTVRLSAKGEEVAQGGEIRLVGGNFDLTFRSGEEQEVTRAFEWGVVLSRELRDGEPMFEIAGEAEDGPAA